MDEKAIALWLWNNSPSILVVILLLKGWYLIRVNIFDRMDRTDAHLENTDERHEHMARKVDALVKCHCKPKNHPEDAMEFIETQAHSRTGRGHDDP